MDFIMEHIMPFFIGILMIFATIIIFAFVATLISNGMDLTSTTSCTCSIKEEY